MTSLKTMSLALVGVLAGSAANAATFDFDFTANSTVGTKDMVEATSKFISPTASNYLQFTDTTSGSTLGLRVFGGHINDAKSGALNTVSVADVADYRNYGLGVSFGSDLENNGTHQIDNGGDGTDFVALVFDQAVALSSFNVTAYAMSGNRYIDYDLSYMAFAGTLADLANGVDVSDFTTVNSSAASWSRYQTPVSSLSGKITTNSSVPSNIWLVSTAIVSPDTKIDGFKLTSLAAFISPLWAPEPATWAMMVVGFGAIGASLRSRGARATMNARFGG